MSDGTIPIPITTAAARVRARGLELAEQSEIDAIAARDEEAPGRSGNVIPMRGPAIPYADAPHPADAADQEDPMSEQEPSAGPAPLRWRAPDLAGRLREFRKRLWISLSIGAAHTEIVRAPAGSVIVLNAPTGGGKTSIAVQIAGQHAAHVGIAVVVSLEMSAEEIAARLVGQTCDLSWEEVLRGRTADGTPISEDEIVRATALPRLVILDEERATLDEAAIAVATLRAEYGADVPLLAVVDYIQIMPSAAREIRDRTATNMIALRRWARKVGAVVLALSQTSRPNSVALAKGDNHGADTTAAGAESAQIERESTITLALGDYRDREDGTKSVAINIGKGRYGGGDRVLPTIWNPRSGAFRVSGDAITGSEARAAAVASKDAAAVDTVKLTVLGALGRAADAMSRRELGLEIGGKAATRVAAIDALLASGEIIEVTRKVGGGALGGAFPLWTPAAAAAAGIPTRPRGVS